LKLHMMRTRLDSGPFEHIPQSHARPSRIADGSSFPLHAGCMRAVERPSIAAALQHGGHTHRFELFEIGKAEDE
jgi:hypothetical protein